MDRGLGEQLPACKGAVELFKGLLIGVHATLSV